MRLILIKLEITAFGPVSIMENAKFVGVPNTSVWPEALFWLLLYPFFNPILTITRWQDVQLLLEKCNLQLNGILFISFLNKIIGIKVSVYFLGKAWMCQMKKLAVQKRSFELRAGTCALLLFTSSTAAKGQSQRNLITVSKTFYGNATRWKIFRIEHLENIFKSILFTFAKTP